MENNYETEEFILVFKTNIKCKEEVKNLTPIMDSGFGNSKWSVDLSDVDSVLRIESIHSDTDKVIKMINNAGFACEELLD